MGSRDIGDVIAHADAEASKEGIVATGNGADGTAEELRKMRGNSLSFGGSERTRMLDPGLPASELAADVSEVSAEQRAERVRRARLSERREHRTHAISGDGTALKGKGEEALGFSSDGGGRHREKERLASELLDGGLVEARALGVIEGLLEHLGGGFDHEARDFRLDFRFHLGALGLDGGLGLRDHFSLGCRGFRFCRFNGLGRREASLGENLDRFVGGLGELDFGNLVSLSEAARGGLCVGQAFFDEAVPFFHLAQRWLDREAVEHEGEEREIDELNEQVGTIDAEAAEQLDDIGDWAVGFGSTSGRRGMRGGFGRFSGEEGGEEGHGEDFEKEGEMISAGKRSGGPLAGPRHETGYLARKIA